MSDISKATYPAKLRFLADLFDKHDRRALAEKLNVTEAEVPDYMLSANSEVQADLRHVADEMERLRAAVTVLRESIDPDQGNVRDHIDAYEEPDGRCVDVADIEKVLRLADPGPTQRPDADTKETP